MKKDMFEGRSCKCKLEIEELAKKYNLPVWPNSVRDTLIGLLENMDVLGEDKLSAFDLYDEWLIINTLLDD